MSGNPAGVPVIVLHGGPGAGINQKEIEAYDPVYYRIVTFDQRGAGESTPNGETKENTTADLIEDIDKIRTHLGIKDFILAGGSWGTTLALLYAQQHPKNVKGLILRATYLNRCEDMEWMYGPTGVRNLYPAHWDDFVSIIPENQRDNVVAAYETMINHTDPVIQTMAASTWNEWPAPTANAVTRSIFRNQQERDEALHYAKVSVHYFTNNMFIAENEILSNIDRIKHIPIEIVHGNADMITRLCGAVALKNVHPLAELTIAKGAAHSIQEPDLFASLMSATERMKTRWLESHVPIIRTLPQTPAP